MNDNKLNAHQYNTENQEKYIRIEEQLRQADIENERLLRLIDSLKWYQE